MLRARRLNPTQRAFFLQQQNVDMHRSRHILTALTFSILASSASFAQEPGLPGNATSLRETHGDWTVDCALVTSPDGNKSKRCSFSQQKIAGAGAESKGVKRTLILPFGLSLQRGETYQLDDGAVGAVQKFRTCLTAGCLIDVDFDARTAASLRTVKVLKVKTKADGGQEMVFSVSLTGYSGAYDGVVALMR